MTKPLCNYTNDELLQELLTRQQHTIPLAPESPEPTITPYEVLKRMISMGWEEDPRKGYSDERITKMWKYVGFPNLTDDDSYCAGTVNACLKLCGYEMSDSVPVARSFVSYGKRISGTNNYQKGDIVVYSRNGSDWRGHVGFYDGHGFSWIKLAGGNQNNKMNISSYPLIKDSTYTLLSVRRISEANKVRGIDWDTLRAWRLVD